MDTSRDLMQTASYSPAVPGQVLSCSAPDHKLSNAQKQHAETEEFSACVPQQRRDTDESRFQADRYRQVVYASESRTVKLEPACGDPSRPLPSDLLRACNLWAGELDCDKVASPGEQSSTATTHWLTSVERPPARTSAGINRPAARWGCSAVASMLLLPNIVSWGAHNASLCSDGCSNWLLKRHPTCRKAAVHYVGQARSSICEEDFKATLGHQLLTL